MKNNDKLSPFRTSSIQNNGVLSNPESPFNILNENEFEQLEENLLKNQNTYVVTNTENDILKIKTVIKYVLLTFKNHNDEIIYQMKSLPGNDIVTNNLPKFISYENLVTKLMEYKVYAAWKNQNNQFIPSVVPSYHDTFYPVETNVTATRYASIIVSSDLESGQEVGSIGPFIINSPINLYIKNTSYLGYVFKPTISRVTNGNNIEHTVAFKIGNLMYKPGQSEFFEVNYKVYNDTQFNNEIFDLYVRIFVNHKSGQPIGD